MGTICLMLAITIDNNGFRRELYVEENNLHMVYTKEECLRYKILMDKKAKIINRNHNYVRSIEFKCECE